ncbi:MAG: 30S ribosomal protein S12 methylthiotransferase RimO [Bacteroidia bacterium]|nr:MAG: 30S ribosomal protein S12 methylthiotransferase RimO [Bacteroidia bacterium]
MKTKKVNIVTLGCSKNLVDTEFLIRQLEASGIEVRHNSNSFEAKIAVINTCGFILDAKEESIDTILRFSEAKKQGLIEKILVIGCLSERYKEELQKEIPEIDGVFGKFQQKEVVQYLKADYNTKIRNERTTTTPKHYAYLKISEGCNRTCSFCAIPQMTGKHVSKPVEDLIAEANYLTSKGAKELLIIAQDLSYYGLDLDKKTNKLAFLLQELEKIDKIQWIKLHYAYPAKFPHDILPLIASSKKICSYLDIALQHISDNMLTKMRRNISKQATYDLIKNIRTQIPDIALRTSLLVGHPGETKQDFKELMKFVQDIRFERLGVFTYSHEEETFAYKNYTDDVSEETKEERKDAIMNIQQKISYENNIQRIGTVQKVIVDREEKDFFIGRTQYDSPEVDGEVLISKKDKTIRPGQFYKVNITNANDYDLYGEIFSPA